MPLYHIGGSGWALVGMGMGGHAILVREFVPQEILATLERHRVTNALFVPAMLQFLTMVPGAAVPALKKNEFSSISIPAPAQLPARTGRLALPVNGVFTQYFWWGHTGVDLAAPYGTAIMASDDGIVVATGWVPVGGLRVCVQHSEGLQTCYYHTSSVYVSAGQSVVRGQPIAAIGMTGVTTGPHVHWELKVNGVAVNPLAY